MPNILIIDDDKIFCDSLSKIIKGMGHEVQSFFTLKEGLAQAMSGIYDVVFLDVGLPDGNGLEVIPEIRGSPTAPEVIIMTGSGDLDGAELAIKNGAWDYLEKPASLKEITLPLIRTLQYREEKKTRKEPVALKQAGLVGTSPPLRNCLDLLAKAASSDANVLIRGETGTGKEVFAYAIHQNSPRVGKNFIIVDCTSIPENLVESILFGHEKGAFTGADRPHDGLIRQAHGGTLFLDEVGELPLSIQKSFLRVLQEHRFRPLRGTHEIESHFRLVSATNRNLEQLVRDGQFRQDLLFRLQSFIIEIPPLRERREDIPELVLHQLNRLSRQYKTGIKGFSPEFLAALQSYDWPGNVRELFQTLERAFAVALYEPTLFPAHLPNNLLIRLTQGRLSKGFEKPSEAVVEPVPLSSRSLTSFKKFREQALNEIENNYFQELISQAQGDPQKACRIAHLSRARLYELLKKHRVKIR